MFLLEVVLSERRLQKRCTSWTDGFWHALQLFLSRSGCSEHGMGVHIEAARMQTLEAALLLSVVSARVVWARLAGICACQAMRTCTGLCPPRKAALMCSLCSSVRHSRLRWMLKMHLSVALLALPIHHTRCRDCCGMVSYYGPAVYRVWPYSMLLCSSSTTEESPLKARDKAWALFKQPLGSRTLDALLYTAG